MAKGFKLKIIRCKLAPNFNLLVNFIFDMSDFDHLLFFSVMCRTKFLVLLISSKLLKITKINMKLNSNRCKKDPSKDLNAYKYS